MKKSEAITYSLDAVFIILLFYVALYIHECPCAIQFECCACLDYFLPDSNGTVWNVNLTFVENASLIEPETKNTSPVISSLP